MGIKHVVSCATNQGIELKLLTMNEQAVKDALEYQAKKYSNCILCTNLKPQNISCPLLEQIKTNSTSLTKDASVSRLCNNLNSLINVGTLTAIKDLSLAERNLFLDDILTFSGQNINHIGIKYNLQKLYPDGVFGWKKSNSMRPNLNYRKDVLANEELADLLNSNNSTLLTTLGNEAGLKAILEANKRLPCNTCANGIAASHLNFMAEYLKDLKYFAQVCNSASPTGVSKVLNLIKSNTSAGPSIRKVEPQVFVLRCLREDNISNVTEFEAIFTGCQPDVILEGGIICEYKSWKNKPIVVASEEEDEEDVGTKYDRTKDMFWNFKNGYTGYSQFKGYMALQEVTTLNELRYYFDERKITTTPDSKPEKLKFVKEQFRDLLYNSTTNTLTTKGEEIWGILSGKGGLLSDIGIDPGLGQNVKQALFTEMIKNMGNFYKFIYVR